MAPSFGISGLRSGTRIVLCAALGLVLALLALGGTWRSREMCDVCLSTRQVRRVGIAWPWRVLVPISSSGGGDSLLFTRVLSPAGHVHEWSTLSGAFSSLVLYEVSHGRVRPGDLSIQLASSDELISRAEAALREQRVTVSEIEAALRFESRGSGSRAVRDRVCTEIGFE